MNILPLIFAFIIVFSLCSSLFIEEKKTTFTEVQNYIAYMKMQRDLHNQLEKKRYSSASSPAKNQKKKDKEKDKNLNPNTIYQSRREFYPPLEISRINISLLIEEPNHPSFDLLYSTTATLLKELYSHASFYTEGFENHILDTIIEAKDLKTIPYKVLKGTTYYNIASKEGYPPLTEFLFIDKSTKDKPIHFCFATPLLLKSLLGEKLTLEILKREKTKWDKDHKHHTVTKAELQTLLPPSKISLLELLNFSKRASPKKEMTSFDSTTNLNLKIEI